MRALPPLNEMRAQRIESQRRSTARRQAAQRRGAEMRWWALVLTILAAACVLAVIALTNNYYM
jgi:cytochrome c-type biogenesis protein CcmH/NrfG